VAGVGKRDMSVPSSAMISWAVVTPMPGISSSWATWAVNGAMALSIRVVSVSIWAVSASTRSTIMASRNAWCSVKCPVSAWRRTLILARILLRARSASACGSRCPAIRAASMSRPETPKMSEITLESFTWASSSSFSARCFSRVRSWVKTREAGPETPPTSSLPIPGG
jgi:hypothetical protein